MAADFNAGSIEGTLDLDLTPFGAGLDRAKAMASNFEKKKVTPEADLDTSGFTTKKDVADAELDKFGHKKATAKADLDIAPALAKFAILNKVLDAGGLGKSTTSIGLMTGKIFALTGGLLGLLAAAGPVSIALAGIGAAGIAAFGGIAISMGLFMAVAGQAVKTIMEANKAGVTLTGWAGQAQTALKSLTDAWHGLLQATAPHVYGALAAIFKDIAGVIPKLAPLINDTADGVRSFATQVLAITNKPIFGRFLRELGDFMNGFLHGAGPVIVNLLDGFMHAFIVLQPLMAMLGHGLAQAAAAADQFASGSGLHNFVSFAMSAIPMVVHLVGSLVSGVTNLIGQLQPLAEPAIHFIERLVHQIGQLNIRPLAKGFGDVFDALGPLLPVLGDLVNTILGPLGHLLSHVAKDALEPLAHSLRANATPAFAALHDILHALVKPLSLFIGSIANLVNPTGVALATSLLQGLAGIVQKVAGPFGKLAVALESVIDDGIEAIMPLLPGLGGALGIVADAAAWLAGGLATILSHKAVVDVLLGLFAAFKALEIISSIVGMVTALVAAFETFGAIAAAEGIMAGIAAVSPALAAGIDLVGAAIDFALGPVGLIIIGIAALAAGLIYAYKHSETFRNIVNGAFSAVKQIAGNVLQWLGNAVSNTIDFVKNHWQLILGILTGPIGAAVIFLISHWSAIKNGFSNLMSDVQNVVRTGVNNVEQFFVQLPGKLLNLVGQMVNAGKSLMGGIFHGLESAASAAGGFAANIAGAIWNELKSVLNNILPHELHIAIPHAPDINVPLFPYLAKGGVTQGPMAAMIGDNPGGQEAVVPLDKYDLPRKGDLAALSSRTEESNSRIIALLGVIAGHLSGQDPDSMAAALADVLGKQSDHTSRRMLQMARAS